MNKKVKPVFYTKQAEEDIRYWAQTNRKIFDKIKELIHSISESPFKGIGKPEPLKGDLQGCWSRRINAEHRLVYEVLNDKIIVHQARYYYQ